MNKINLLIIIMIIAAAATSCSTKRVAVGAIGKIAHEGIANVESEEDVAFARESALPLIKTMEVFKVGNPKNRDILLVLSGSYAQFAFGFLEEDLLSLKPESSEYKAARKRADLFYRRGREYGIAALTRSCSMRKAFAAPFPDFQKAVNGLGKKYAESLFWTSFNWINWLNLNADDPSAIADLPRIEAMVKRTIELDSSFYYGSAHSLLGAIAASRPKMLGGNPELAEAEFRKAMEISPDYLMTKVMYAQFYARQMGDKELFVKALTDVREAKSEALPEQRLANELARQRAKLLLGMKDKLF